MRITIINGSPRTNGSTAYILHRFEHEFCGDGTEINFIDLSEKNILQCKGCCSCYKNGSCFIKDDADQISSQIVLSDIVILGSPTFASNVSGIMKSFIDRGHLVVEQLLYNKYVICITTYENYGGRDTAKILKKLAVYSGAKYSRAKAFKSVFNGNCATEYVFNQKINRFVKSCYRSVNQRKSSVFQIIRRKFIIKIGLKKFVVKKGNKYQAVLKRWKQLGID